MNNPKSFNSSADADSLLGMLPLAISACDASGIITYMNDTAAALFGKSGGGELLGSDLLACHPEPSRTLVADMLENHGSRSYTIQKNAKHKIIHQTALFQHGQFAGLAEISFEIPQHMPHFDRDPVPAGVGSISPGNRDELINLIQGLNDDGVAALLQIARQMPSHRGENNQADSWNQVSEAEMDEYLNR